jgi:hypothetical protein
MQGDVYTALAEAVATAGGIDMIGATDDVGKTALSFAGVNIEQRYFDGTVRGTVIFQITGACLNAGQEDLVDTLCDIGHAIKAATLSVEGFQRPKVKVTSLPTAVLHDSDKWVYSSRVQVTGYYKE